MSDNRDPGVAVPPNHGSIPPPALSSIPLTDPRLSSGEPSIGGLVKDASAQVSTLVRSEVALAKAELTAEVKKAVTGGAAFAVAGAVLLFSSFFFFVFLAELLDKWVARWLAFLIVFLILLFSAIVIAVVGFLVARKIRGPAKTISTVKKVSTVLPTKRKDPAIAQTSKDTQAYLDRQAKA